MNCLSLLFASATQGSSNASAMRSAIPSGIVTFANPPLPPSEAAPSASDHRAGGLDDYLLPSGIASMEHWLDLNA